MIILEEVANFIVSLVIEEKTLSIDHVHNYNGKKLAIGISLYSDPIISLEILPSGVCDMMIIDVDTEDIKYSVTEEFINIEDLKEGIVKFFDYIRLSDSGNHL